MKIEFRITTMPGQRSGPMDHLGDVVVYVEVQVGAHAFSLDPRERLTAYYGTAEAILKKWFQNGIGLYATGYPNMECKPIELQSFLIPTHQIRKIDIDIFEEGPSLIQATPSDGFKNLGGK